MYVVYFRKEVNIDMLQIKRGWRERQERSISRERGRKFGAQAMTRRKKFICRVNSPFCRQRPPPFRSSPRPDFPFPRPRSRYYIVLGRLVCSTPLKLTACMMGEWERKLWGPSKTVSANWGGGAEEKPFFPLAPVNVFLS